MLIKLPPGMTPEQYFQTPEGQRTAERQGQDYQNLTIADDSPPRPTKYTYRPPGITYRSPITRPPARQLQPAASPAQVDPGFQYTPPPIVPLPPYTGAGARQPAMRKPPAVGQAQPKADPYEAATKTPMDTFQEIFEALEEMAPDLPSHQRRQIAQQLADEYRRERSEAIDSLGSPPPMAEPTEQMEFDQAYSDMEAGGRAEDRMKARMEAQLREDAIAERGRVSPEVQRARNQQRAASMLPQGPRKVTDGVLERNAQFDGRTGMPGAGAMPTPGMAQAIPPPSQGDPLGGRSKQDMYRELVDGGMSPAEASRAVEDFFAYMPR